MPKFTHAIFDFDGTIADSMSIWTTAASDYLRSKGMENAGDIDNLARPKGLMETVMCMKEHFCLQDAPQDIFDEICNTVGERYKNDIPLKSGILEILEDLRAKNIGMCIATASTKEHVAAALKRWGIYDFFCFIITCDEVGIGKYSPLIYCEAAKKMQCEPARCLVFEDGVHGVISAHQAGFFVVGIYEESLADQKERVKANCDFYLSDLKNWQGIEYVPPRSRFG